MHHSQQLTIQQLWTAEDKTLGLVLNEFTHENEHHALEGVRVKSVNNTSAFVQGETQAALSTADLCPASGKVRPEMVVKSVNEKDVSELGLEALIKVIKTAGRPLRISFLHEHCSARIDESGKTEAQVIVDACEFQVPCIHATSTWLIFSLLAAPSNLTVLQIGMLREALQKEKAERAKEQAAWQVEREEWQVERQDFEDEIERLAHQYVAQSSREMPQTRSTCKQNV